MFLSRAMQWRLIPPPRDVGQILSFTFSELSDYH